MQKILNLSILLLVLVSTINLAQDSFRIKLGYGNYYMKSLKRMASNVAGSYRARGIDAQIVDDFPANFNYQFQYFPKNSRQEDFGIFISYKSTGARIAYSDYSGGVKSDFIVSGYSAGGIIELIGPKILSLETVIYVQPSIIYSTLLLKDEVIVYGVKASEEASFNTLGGSFEAGIQARIDLPGKFSAGFNAGLEFSYSPDFKLDENSDAYLPNTSPDWMGVRIGMMVRYE